jgi:hypothetical protein
MSSGVIVILLFFIITALYGLSQSSTGQKQQYGVTSITSKGEIVKSHSERIIADYFSKNGVRYEYEHYIRGVGKPDFYLPDYGVVVEFWGLVDANDETVRKRYVKSMRWKMAQYHSRNIKFISIYPSNLASLDYYFKNKFYEVTGLPLKRTHH